MKSSSSKRSNKTDKSYNWRIIPKTERMLRLIFCCLDQTNRLLVSDFKSSRCSYCVRGGFFRLFCILYMCVVDEIYRIYAYL